MVTREQAIELSNKYNLARHPKEDFALEGVCETSSAYYLFYKDWKFNMNKVDKKTGKVISDNHLLHLNEKEYMNAPYEEV